MRLCRARGLRMAVQRAGRELNGLDGQERAERELQRLQDLRVRDLDNEKQTVPQRFHKWLFHNKHSKLALSTSLSECDDDPTSSSRDHATDTTQPGREVAREEGRGVQAAAAPTGQRNGAQQGAPRTQPEPTTIVGLFEFWLYKEAARLMGYIEKWEQASAAPSNQQSRMLVPTWFALDDAEFTLTMFDGRRSDSNKYTERNKKILLGTWWE